MQETVTERQEAMRQATEEKVQAARRQTDAMKAELERENMRAKALADAEGRAAEARANEDVTRRLLLSRVEAETSKAVAVIQAAATNIGEGTRALLADPQRLATGVAGATALALGVYGAREGTRVGFRYLERVLGQPSLVRETSRRSPWQRLFGSASQPPPLAAAAEASASGGGAAGATAGGSAGAVPLGDVVLEHSLAHRVRGLAAATAATRQHGAPFRNMMFYGPPGTGKTLAAKRLARYSGLDYAVLSGGDIAPLGARAVTEIHALFDWASVTKRGMLLFIDEADAFLSKRGGGASSDEVRSALNALLFRTGSPSRDVALVLATNRPEDLDAAVLDRVDDALEFPLPGEQERLALLRLYFSRYVGGANAAAAADADVLPTRRLMSYFSGGATSMPPIDVDADVTEAVFKDAAARTEGFSGRELAKLMNAVQAAVYGSPPPRLLRAAMFSQVVDYKVREHAHKRNMLATGAAAASRKRD
jgi:ATPase family AAA domain-containing protein 3A/B